MSEEFNDQQIRQIDAVYESVIDVVATMTGKPVTEIGVEVYGELADVIAEYLTDIGYDCYFPTMIDDRIVDIYE